MNNDEKRIIAHSKAVPLTDADIDSVSGGATEIKVRTIDTGTGPDTEYEYDT